MMMYFTKTLLLTALMCIGSQAQDIPIYKRTWDTSSGSSDKSLVQGTLSQTDDSTYPFANCKWTKPNKEKTCDVTLVIKGQKDRTCSGVKIFAGKNKDLFFNGFFQVTPFEKDHVLLGWYDQAENTSTEDHKDQSLHFGILNINTCKTANLAFPIDKTSWDFLPGNVIYPNQIHVVLNSHSTCSSIGSDNCRVVYDLDGKQIGDPHPYLADKSQYAVPVSKSDPKKGFFEFVRDEKTITVLFVDSTGKGKQLSKVDLEPHAKKHRFYFSGSHGLFAYCRVPDLGPNKPTKIFCEQFNHVGKTLQKIIDIPENVGWLSVRNLAEGEILLARSGCDKPKNDGDCNEFPVTKITSNIATNKSFKLGASNKPCYDMLDNLQTRISENVDSYCFDFSCLASQSHLDYSSTCVPKRNVN